MRAKISIHALRVEGDDKLAEATNQPKISIHALRVEGDSLCEACHNKMHPISIHALRVEGDHQDQVQKSIVHYFYPRPPGGGRRSYMSRICCAIGDFYPRPPGGGRRVPFFALCSICRFLSTPSGWRATFSRRIISIPISISIHALRVEGDCFQKDLCAR